jgi:predicted metal-dependent phosphotriesterase family hydrolase
VSFVRTVLGDVAQDQLGLCYAHEHVVIRGKWIEENFPDFQLDDLEAITAELMELRLAGVCTMIDAMPTDSGRSADDLILISQRTTMNIVAATGLHLRIYYPGDHWFDTIDDNALVDLFVGEITVSMKDSRARAGVIKVAGSLDRLTELERRNFRAAGRAQRQTGCPILTHTEQGAAALEQVQILIEAGADPAHVVLSHLDRIGDIAYHREVLSTGVRLEFDSAFRWGSKPNQTLQLILALAPEFPDQIVLGMDAARTSYWRSYGGKPGLRYLVDEFGPILVAAGLEEPLLHKILFENPAGAFAFCAAEI